MNCYLHESHNTTVLFYHPVFPAEYGRAVIDATVDQVLKEVCLEIEARYRLKFLKIGTDMDHVYLLVRSVPTCSVGKLVTIIESLTAREIFRRCPEVKKRLWGGEFWANSHFAITVGRHGNEKIGDYVRRQGSGYRKLHEEGLCPRGNGTLRAMFERWYPTSRRRGQRRPCCCHLSAPRTPMFS